MTALFSLEFQRSFRASCSRSFARAALIVSAMSILFSGISQDVYARPTSKGKSSGMQVQSFLRQTNVYSNLEFFYTNRGVLFNAGQGENEGCFWPRGSGDSYIFGEGLWFATQKEIQGKRHKLCDLGYNPNSGAGWYLEGEASQVGLNPGSDGATPAAKYISYVSPRYDKSSGKYLSGSSSVVPSPGYPWPLWDTAVGKTLNHNYYFGDYISDVTKRNIGSLASAGKPNPVPAITSEEDILNFYSDEDPSNNPEFRPGTGYPFGIDIQEEIYSWSFGRYRDMIFLRHKVTNSSGDSLLNCWMAPAFDPDLDAQVGGAANDGNSYVDSALVAQDADPTEVSQMREPYRSDPKKLNMGVQWRNFTQPPGGAQYGWVGFSFLESPVIDASGNIVPNSDSVGLGGYCGPTSLFEKTPTPASPSGQLGLATFRDWIILNDPSTEDLRYDFVSSGDKDLFNGVYQDQRLLMSTGPFTLPPGKSVETTVGIGIAQIDNNSYKKNFGALLLLMDFAHEIFGEVDSTYASSSFDSTSGKFDTTWNCSCNHFLSPRPPFLPTVTTTALDKAVLISWDSVAEHSTDAVSDLLSYDSAFRTRKTLDFLGYQLWRSTRSDHDSTIRPDGNNPDVMLGKWSLYNFTTDSVFDSKGHFNHFHYARTSNVPNPIPHSYLDVGDDNHDGVLTGNEGLFNNVTYYYYLLAFDEFDSTNQIGPLYTAIVTPQNFVKGIPNKPVYLASFTGDTASNVNSCLAGSQNSKFGGVQDVRLGIVDTGIFAKLFTNDTINVSFQPRWTEFNAVDASPCYFYVDVTDNKNGIQNTYKNLQVPANNTNAYVFPTTLPGTLVYHVDGTFTPDSVFAAQFTTDNPSFAPNQKVDQAFTVLADVNLEQLSTPYRLSAVSVTPGQNNSQLDKNILRLSRRTNNSLGNYDTNQTIYNLPSDSAPRPPVVLGTATFTLHGTPLSLGQKVTHVQLGTSNDTVYIVDKIGKQTIDCVTNPGVCDTQTTYTSDTPYYYYTINSTRPAFIGGLGEVQYEVAFDSLIGPKGPQAVVLQNGDVIYPPALHMTISLAGCPQSILRQVQDSATDMTEELIAKFYAVQTSSTGALPFNDPDTMFVPNPGWFRMVAFHYADQSGFDQVHTNATFYAQGNANGTVGPYYYPLGLTGNMDNTPGATQPYHLAVHKLSVGGAEIIFNAPEVPDASINVTGDTIAGIVTNHINPHTNDFEVGDQVTLSFTGMMKNLPFPGAPFTIKTEAGPSVNFANSNNYVDSILAQVQVVPNPYIVTHLGQTSTDNAKLFFTRLPPRCTIEIYALDGTLVTTIEHYGFKDTTVIPNPKDPAVTQINYFTNPVQLSDQTSVETWNLLTSGLQRVGSQVLFARVVAKDPNSNAEIGEVTTKFAVVVGLSK